MIEFHKGTITEVVGRQVIVGDTVGVETPSKRSHRFIAGAREPLTIRLHLFAGVNRRQWRWDPARLQAARGIGSGAYLANTVFPAGFDDCVLNLIRVFPWAEQFPARLPHHSVTQGTNVTSRDFEDIHIEELDVRRSFSGGLLHRFDGIGTLDLESENFSPTLIDRRPFVSFRLGIVAAGFQVVLNPAGSRRPPDEVELVFIEIKKDGIADDVPVGVTCNKLLGLIDSEILEGVHAEI